MPLIQVENSNSLTRYEFSGSSLPTDWNIIAHGTGQTVTVASSTMTIAANTTASATTTVRCTKPIRPKVYVRFIVQLSQRIANQNFYLEITNAAGTTYARYDLNGTTATTGQCVTANQGTANTAVSVTIPTTASYATLDIYADTNDVVFSSVASNTNAVKSGIASFDRLILDPNEDYYVQVSAVNSASAPASNTNLIVDSVVIQDLTAMKVDVIRGDGTAALSNATPVQVMTSSAVTVNGGAAHDGAVSGNPMLCAGYASSSTPTAVSAVGDVTRLWATLNGALIVAQPTLFFNESTTALAASATFTGTSRDNGGTTAASVTIYGAFNVTAFADQAGTVRIEMSNDSTTWRRATADTAVTANSVITLSVPVVTRYYRAVYVNGATLQTAFMINSSYSQG